MVKSEMLGLWALLVVISEVTCHYTSQWAAHIEGGPAAARKIADAHGFTLLAEIFPDTYHLEHRRVAKRSAEQNREHHEKLTSDRRVKWAQQQRARRRRKRDFLTKKELGVGEEHIFANDARWKQMWYLNRGYGLDMSVEGAWKQGITGKGIVVTILDDGLEKDHPDLKENYDPQASYDVNGHDDDPMPRYDLIDSNRHGTRCAGEVAAVANNSICSLGIAYKASVGGVRMLDGDVTDAVEARSLSLNTQHIDIYSASWGPDDDGKTVDGPGELATRAFVEGVTKGRGGRGSIFVWASGNGGRDHDNCNCDGYTNSIWTLSISSATEDGYVPWYSEACSSTLATTYSSGSAGEKQIVTTDLHHTCTSSHTGTSASAPLAAGICALALEANTLLTWRDMQHIVVSTAKPANLKATDWVTNGVGRNVSHSFGYGLMDATAMVKLARIWHTVPQQQKCEVTAPHADKVIPAKSHVTLQLLVKDCPGVNYLEHVQAKITLMSQRRGDIQIQLTSPAGTKTTLLARRPHDVSRSGFRSWPFMSVHTWGENPVGIWTLEIHNEARYLAQLSEWNLIFYGTDTPAGVEPESIIDTASGVAKQPLSPLDANSRNFDNSVDPSAPSSRWKEVTQRNGPSSTSTNLKSDVSAGSSVPSSSQQNNNNNIPDDYSSSSTAAGGVSGASSPSGCRTSTRTCLECNPGRYLWHGSCEDVCPTGSFRVDTHCEPCHYSCRFCLGPNDYECTECHPDATLYASSDTGENFCLPKTTLPSLDYTKWLYRSFWALLLNAVLLGAAGGVFYYRQRGCRCRHSVIGNGKKSSEAIVRYNLTANEMSDSE